MRHAHSLDRSSIHLACLATLLSLPLLFPAKNLSAAQPAPAQPTPALPGHSHTDGTDHAPAGWFLTGSDPASYRTGVDRATVHDGQPSAFLASTQPSTRGFGTLMQSINASAYTGKRVRLRASVQSRQVAGWAGMWMRVDANKTTRAFDNMEDRSIKGTASWQPYDVVLDVPADATTISFGILLSGTGEVWLNHVTLEPVGPESTATGPQPVPPPLSLHPVNTDFTQ